MKCKHCGSKDFGSSIIDGVCTFCVDLEDNGSVYQSYKKAGYYEQIECKHCEKPVDRYLHKAHESRCRKQNS